MSQVFRLFLADFSHWPTQNPIFLFKFAPVIHFSLAKNHFPAMYRIVYFFARLMSMLPFGVLFVLSDFVCLILYRVVGYRVKVVRRNLQRSFPDKSEAELRVIERRFYRWFCDYFVETLKLLDMSADEMKRHLEWHGIEDVEQCFDRGQHVAIFLGHYCNWEWMSACGLYLERHKEAVAGLIYHPLRQKNMDKLMLAVRSHFGGTCIDKHLILRYLVRYKRENRMTIFGYIADQSPKWENIHLWLDFMHQDTPVFTGAERIARKMDNATFYCDLQRVSRGHYVARFVKMEEHPAQLEEFDLTRQFFTMLEQSIRRQPECYLWTHDRWKRQRVSRSDEVLNTK